MLNTNIKKMCVMPLVSPSVSINHLERCIWSVESQTPIPFEFEIVIVVNSLDELYSKAIKTKFEKNYEVFITESNGKSGKGHNARYDTYRKIYKDRGFTHIMPVDGDDFYYPMAFGCIAELDMKSRFDYLSGICPFVDSINVAESDYRADSGFFSGARKKINLHHNLQRPGPSRSLYSFVASRLPVMPSGIWDGMNCPGGEPVLALSNRAIDCNLRYLDAVGLADDYPHLCQAIVAYLRGEMVFVGTDCNDIYVYDCSHDTSSSRQYQILNAKKGWPFDAEGHLEAEIRKPQYSILRGITRQHLPYATLPQVWDQNKKKQYVMENLL